MSNLTPIATYNLALQPFQPVPAIEDDFPISIRITLASLDPEAADDKAEPSSLRILKKSNSLLSDDYFEDDDDDEEDDEEDELDDEEEEEEAEEEEKSSKKSNGKKSSKKDEDEEDDDEEEDDEDDDEDEDDVSEYIVCTLSPKHQYQQTLDLTITPDEEVYFVVTGSYPIHLTGNYIEHPADQDEEDYDDEDEDYDDEYDLSPDEDEIIYGAPLDDEYDDEEESEEEGTPKIEEIVEEKEKEKVKESPKESKKRVAEESTSKKSKKAKKDEKKSVQFSKELEQGPTGSTLVEKDNKKATPTKDKKETPVKDDGDKKKKFPTKTLLGGVITEDRKIGSGATAKSGAKVGIRYIGKLKNGKVFDKNTSGKPFSFKLGKGECIKGFDLGVTGMAVGGERRVIIPPKMGYGSQALPGIPANSELTFDIKLVSLK